MTTAKTRVRGGDRFAPNSARLAPSPFGRAAGSVVGGGVEPPVEVPLERGNDQTGRVPHRRASRGHLPRAPR